MNANANIRYLRRHEINDAAWNCCIDDAANGLIYAYTFYLDALCTNWDALVLNDYEAVMPLPWRKKFGIKYVYQPSFIQRLGIFGSRETSNHANGFFERAMQHFKFMHYNIHSTCLELKAHISERTNYIIPLNGSYQDICNKYTAQGAKNIRKSMKRGCTLTSNISPGDIVSLYKQIYGSRQQSVSDHDYNNFCSLLSLGIKNNFAETYSVVNEQNETVYSGAIFKDAQRIYYIMGAPTPKGRQLRATYFFIDQLLRKNENSNRFFDMEGSDLPDVAHFYQQFGPIKETYLEIKCNRLPFPLYLLKK